MKNIIKHNDFEQTMLQSRWYAQLQQLNHSAYDFNQNMEGLKKKLPSRAESLTFGYDFNQKIL